MKKVFEGRVEYQSEDGGQALIASIYDEVPPRPVEWGGMFVRLQSWKDETPEQNASGERPVHQEAEKFRGKKVRITVEVID